MGAEPGPEKVNGYWEVMRQIIAEVGLWQAALVAALSILLWSNRADLGACVGHLYQDILLDCYRRWQARREDIHQRQLAKAEAEETAIRARTAFETVARDIILANPRATGEYPVVPCAPSGREPPATASADPDELRPGSLPVVAPAGALDDSHKGG